MCGFVVVPKRFGDVKSDLMNLRGPDKTSSSSQADYVLKHWLLDVNHSSRMQPIEGQGGVGVWNGQLYGLLNSETPDPVFRDPERIDDDTAFLEEFLLSNHLNLPDFRQLVEKIDGEFALCIVSPVGEVFLATDAFGTKPVSYVILKSGEMVVASYAEDLLRLGFDDVRVLPPGKVAVFANGRFEMQSHSQFRFSYFLPPEIAMDQWNAALEWSLSTRLKTVDRAPIVTLSSGVDSGVVASFANTRNLAAHFYIAPEGEDLDVVDRRTRLLRENGFRVDHISLSTEEFESEKREIEKYFPRFRVQADGFPANFPDPRLHAIPGYVVGSNILRRARTAGQVTCLSGQGVDEIFTDYLNGSRRMASTDGSEQAFFKEWVNFRRGWNATFLSASERIAGIHGFETRYPFLCKPLVQAFLSIPIQLRMVPEKAPLKEYLDATGFGYSAQKRGFLGYRP